MNLDLPDDKATRLILAYLAVIATIGIILVVVTITNPPPPRTPVRFSSSVYLPEQENYCPGEIVSVAIEFETTEKTSVIIIYETFWSVDKLMTVVAGQSRAEILTGGPQLYENQFIRFIVPELPPGRYEYRRGTEERLAYPQAFSVPFTIPEDCGG